MRYKSHLSICLLFVVLFLPSLANAHPDDVDLDGCHICVENCAEWGESTSVKHCHDGELYFLLPDHQEQKRNVQEGLKEEMERDSNAMICRDGTFGYMIDDVKKSALEIYKRLEIQRADPNIDYCHTTPGCEEMLNDHEESISFLEEWTEELITMQHNLCNNLPDIPADTCMEWAESYEQEYCHSDTEAQNHINEARASMQKIISKYNVSTLCKLNIFDKLIQDAKRSITNVHLKDDNSLRHKYIKHCNSTTMCGDSKRLNDYAKSLYKRWIEELEKKNSSLCGDNVTRLSSYDLCMFEKAFLEPEARDDELCEIPNIECDSNEEEESSICMCQTRNSNGTCGRLRCYGGAPDANMCACIDGYVRNSDGICQLTTTPNESALLNSSTRQQRICERIRNREDIKGKFDVINRRLNKRYGFTCTLE